MKITESSIKQFRKNLLVWGKKHFQKFPWRKSHCPYKILVSEFMLHRTRAKQVVPVYIEFINQYPSLAAFNNSDFEEIKKLLNPLGLNWRIENMIGALREISKTHDEVPADYEQLKSIYGIGQYIAGATVCFSSNSNVALIDTNTLRVIGRFWGKDFNERTRKLKKTREFVGKVTHSHDPRNLYFSIIDLSHKICHINNPECSTCPLKDIRCKYFMDNSNRDLYHLRKTVENNYETE